MPAVILCEKPAQAKDLAKALGGATAKGSGWIDCPAARLTWAIGHLVEMAKPEVYDEKYKRWRIDDLPIVPKRWILEPRDGVKDQLKIAVETIRKATIIYIATDAGREGELIAYEIIERAGVHVPIKRLWFSAQDEESLRRAWAKPREASETVRLFHAAQTRQRADWLFGMNLSRASTILYGSNNGKELFSYGRVQTPTLALIVARDREIESFKSRSYYELSAQVRSGSHGLTMTYAPAEDDKRIWSRADAEASLAKLTNAQGAIRVKREAKSQAPPKPYALSDLQGDANSRFGYSAQVTLDLAQSLYEKHKAISYPRSDCNYLPEEMIKELPKMLRCLLQTQAIPNHPQFETPLVRKANFDTTKLSDHHAIVPTPIRAPVEQMSPDERNVFELVAMRFAQILLPDYEYEATTMMLDANCVPLIARGRVNRRMGWRDLEPPPSDEDKERERDDGDRMELPPIRDGSPGTVSSAQVLSKATQAPKRYTERSLLADMKNVGRLVKDERLKKVLKETSGLGTEATRANHIETIKKRDYARLGGPDKRMITSTELGRRFISLLPEVLTLPGLTAAWEDLLESIVKGKTTREAALAALTTHLEKQLAAVIKSRPPAADRSATENLQPSTPRAGVQSRAPASGIKVEPSPGASSDQSPKEKEAPCCPQCSKPMRWRVNRKTEQGFFGCSGYPDCKATIDPNEGASPQKGAFDRAPDCPNCTKRMRLINGSRGPFYGCTGYPVCKTILDVTTGGADQNSGPKPTYRR